MYRVPDTSPRCVACGNTNLTPETRFDPSEGNANIHFFDPKAKQGFLDDGHPTFAVNRARVCLDCGHVMLSLGGTRLEQLRAAIDRLRAVH
jgi:hypothetical protein